MTQRSIEIVVGRLLTDEEFRDSFVEHPDRVIRMLLDSGMHLTLSEIGALMAMDRDVWRRGATEVDPRLQKVSLKKLQ